MKYRILNKVENTIADHQSPDLEENEERLKTTIIVNVDDVMTRALIKYEVTLTVERVS